MDDTLVSVLVCVCSGRQFYKCPERDKEGNHHLFEWADKSGMYFNHMLLPCNRDLSFDLVNCFLAHIYLSIFYF